ncbi:hypothetical protein FRC02_004523 [Tulasnella sp. 418]|nr:hypothetical protein FRC02_004523 [Tulasnella sp. 418]
MDASARASLNVLHVSNSSPNCALSHSLSPSSFSGSLSRLRVSLHYTVTTTGLHIFPTLFVVLLRPSQPPRRPMHLLNQSIPLAVNFFRRLLIGASADESAVWPRIIADYGILASNTLSAVPSTLVLLHQCGDMERYSPLRSDMVTHPHRWPIPIWLPSPTCPSPTCHRHRCSAQSSLHNPFLRGGRKPCSKD